MNYKYEPSKMFPDEVFIPISELAAPDHKPYYLVSNYGRVYNHETGRFMRQHVAENHLYTHIRTDVNGKSKDKTYATHRLMMLSFKGDEYNGTDEVDHVDGCSYNNFLDNMEFVSREENIRRAHLKGVCTSFARKGEDHQNAKMDDNKAREICEMIVQGFSVGEISHITGIPKSTVENIKLRRNWKHIVKDYEWEVNKRGE